MHQIQTPPLSGEVWHCVTNAHGQTCSYLGAVTASSTECTIILAEKVTKEE